jgi:hypothetical protein
MLYHVNWYRVIVLMFQRIRVPLSAGSSNPRRLVIPFLDARRLECSTVITLNLLQVLLMMTSLVKSGYLTECFVTETSPAQNI